jgi:hypothetical protein
MSADGRWVAFQSYAVNIAGNSAGLFVTAAEPPVVDAISPSSIARGATATVVITGDYFTPEATVRAGTQPGGESAATVNSFQYVSPTEIHASVTVHSDAPTGALYLLVGVPGLAPGAYSSTGTCAASACPAIQ